ncbi:MAG: divalent cation tolerance protein CutA [Ferrimicrobium sp.]
MQGFEAVEVVTTTDSVESAERLVDAVVAEGRAACVKTIGPIVTRYWWKGSWHREVEYEVRATTIPQYELAVAATLRGAHTYEVAEISVRLITILSLPYYEWMLGVVEQGMK